MTDRVKQILSFYKAENPGVISKLARILNHGYLGGTGKLVILPVDQGFEHGPVLSFSANEQAHDPHYHFKLAVEAGCSAYSAPLGFLQSGAREFAGEIPLILKINNSDSLYKSAEAPCPALTSSVKCALRLGCAAVGLTIYPGSEKSARMYEQTARVSRQARACGLPVVIWAYPRGKGVSKRGETALDVVAYSAHIAAQLGAHIIKVKPPSDYIENEQAREALKGKDISGLSSRARYVVQSAFNGRRIVIFSGGPAKEKDMFIQEVKELALGGAFGSIVGRNSFKRSFKEGVDLLRQIMDIYKTTPDSQ